MKTTSHDFVTVDMRGLKAALIARAQVEQVALSVIVRRAVVRELYADDMPSGTQIELPLVLHSHRGHVKISMRMSLEDAQRFDQGARAAGLSRGAYLTGLVAKVPVLVDGGSRRAHIETLIASSAELSTLNRNLHHLAALLTQGEVKAAQQYRQVLGALSGDVRAHLALASGVLASLRPTAATHSESEVTHNLHSSNEKG